MPSIYETLKKDHDKHRELLAQLAETTGDSSRRRELWKQFYYDVGGHAAAEEETFYSPLMEKEDGQPKGRHSVAEHKELDDIIQELDEMDMSSPGWMTRFKTLRHDYEHHIDEEEEEIFPVAKKVIGKDEDGAISQSFLKRKARERKIVDEKAEAALEE
ncbi:MULTISPECIES: hemerythrin domain-containing protein [Hyphomonas]|uniref:Hemerythrin n=1 Tax=Hyphomonas atlantica TaxID=1280948 RepID=A0A059DXW5_9PROT|nr:MULTISPECIES: hemerythrin domain-containing protein [Hyphomonas]KCZ58272.1 Hemerythrin [Hyphomonas atlantica]MAM06956.1 hemerythrin [Hyphomonas sp.]